MPASSQLRAAAALLSQRADWLSAVLDPIARLSGAGIWRGPAADRFDDELDGQRRQLRALAEDIALAGRLLSIDADQLDLAPAAGHTAMGRPS